MWELGPGSGIAILDWVSDQTKSQLARGIALSAPSQFPGGVSYSLVIQKFPGAASNTVRIDTLVPEGRKLLTWGVEFEMRAGKTKIASGTVTVPPMEEKAHE